MSTAIEKRPEFKAGQAPPPSYWKGRPLERAPEHQRMQVGRGIKPNLEKVRAGIGQVVGAPQECVKRAHRPPPSRRE